MKNKITAACLIFIAVSIAELGTSPASVCAFSPLSNVKNVHSNKPHVDNSSATSNKREESSILRRVNSRMEIPSHGTNEQLKSKNTPSRREWITSSASAATAAAVLALQSQNAQAATSTLIQADPATRITTPDTMQNILCDPSVSVFKHPNKQRTVYLLGTAHISSKSAEAAAQLVRDMKPKAVFVELDAKRVKRALPNSEKTDEQNKDAITVQSSSTATTTASVDSTSKSSSNTGIGAASAVTIQPDQPTLSKPKAYDVRELALRKGSELLGNSIKGLYQKLESEGFNAGEEFVVAVKEGLNVNAKIILGDRDVEVTLRRLTEALSKTDLKKLLAADSELEANMKQLMPQELNNKDTQNGDSGGMSTEQLKYFVETVKAKDNVRLLMDNLNSVAPEVYQAMVAERDLFMANGLDGLDQFESIVAVMGIAHVDGVETELKRRGWIETKPSC